MKYPRRLIKGDVACSYTCHDEEDEKLARSKGYYLPREKPPKIEVPKQRRSRAKPKVEVTESELIT